jgi:hypothetical protein
MELLEKEAPKTCEAFLKALPSSGLEVRHAKSSGDEVYVQIREMDCPKENDVDPAQGDVAFNPMPDWRAVCIYYGPKITNRIRFNKFARITGDLAGLEGVGNRVWLRGTEKATFKLLDK